MRLKHKEIEAIVSTFEEVFKSGSIYLFGSRVDDALRGGDIDLYIDTDDKDNLFEKKISFLVSLKRKIGEQKIDVVISRDKSRAIEKEALNKGVKLDLEQIKIEKYINECNKHKIRIEKYYKKIEDLLPLSASKYENLEDEHIEAIDGYLFRFAKLQDTMGNKLFPLIVSRYVDDVKQLTFLDILNHLEKIGILEDVGIWRRLRVIRNDISHQYDDDSQEMAEVLNNIFAYKDELLAIFDKTKEGVKP